MGCLGIMKVLRASQVKQEMIPCGDSQSEVVASRESAPHLYRLGTTSAELTCTTEVAMSCICSLILIWKVAGRGDVWHGSLHVKIDPGQLQVMSTTMLRWLHLSLADLSEPNAAAVGTTLFLCVLSGILYTALKLSGSFPDTVETSTVLSVFSLNSTFVFLSEEDLAPPKELRPVS